MHMVQVLLPFLCRLTHAYTRSVSAAIAHHVCVRVVTSAPHVRLSKHASFDRARARARCSARVGKRRSIMCGHGRGGSQLYDDDIVVIVVQWKLLIHTLDGGTVCAAAVLVVCRAHACIPCRTNDRHVHGVNEEEVHGLWLLPTGTFAFLHTALDQAYKGVHTQSRTVTAPPLVLART